MLHYPDHQQALSKRHRRGSIKINHNKRLARYIEGLIKQYWSPEAIAGRLKNKVKCPLISHESNYLWIYRYATHLCPYLRRFHKKRRKRRSHLASRTLIPNRIPIEQRSLQANERLELSHLEADTIICRESKVCICTSVDRKTRLVRITKLKACKVKNMHEAPVKSWGVLSKYNIIQSTTYDNGKENTWHERTNKSLGCRSYFTNPYSSREKGSIEQINGLIRQFIPKKTNLALIAQNNWIKSLTYLIIDPENA